MLATAIILAVIRVAITIALATLFFRSGYRFGYRDAIAGRKPRIRIFSLDEDDQPDDPASDDHAPHIAGYLPAPRPSGNQEGTTMSNRTPEEKSLLAKLASGLLDGPVGRDLETSGGSTVWTRIKDGKPARLKEGPTTRFFNGKENEDIPGKRHILEEWDTDDEKLAFLQKFGWLMADDDARSYSAKFKPKKH